MPPDPAHRIRIQPLGEGSWRVCDTSVSPNDAESVLAYVERKGERYRVTWVRGGRSAVTFDALDDIARVAAARVEAEKPRRRKPVTIAHRPPLAAI